MAQAAFQATTRYWRSVRTALLCAVALSAAAASQACSRSQPNDPPPPSSASTARPAGALPALKVAGDGRRLVRADGSPFFYLGDTAWALFHKLTREEADLYLTDRADKGFSVIQAVALAEIEGLSRPNAYGQTPLLNDNPATPNPAYFEHVDYVIDKAASLGIYTGLLPTWGSYWHDPDKTIFTPENARGYGAWLAARYRDRPIIWILGGDRPIDNDRQRDIIEAMAAGIRSVVGDTQLITFHPYGGRSSAEWFHDRPWLDFNMFQSGHHFRDNPNYQGVAKDRALVPPKPTMDGEPRYENHIILQHPTHVRFDDHDVRQAAYWDVLSGSLGHVYGNHNIWQFYDPGRPHPAIANPAADWKTALTHPGAAQMGHMRLLFESRPFQDLEPDQGLIVAGQADGADYVAAARGRDYAFVYVPWGRTVTVALNKFPGPAVKAWWFDPRSGEATQIATFDDAGSREFDPPGAAGENDWVLVLDDASRTYPPPGTRAPRSEVARN